MIVRINWDEIAEPPCEAKITVEYDDTIYEFPEFCLVSGGECWRDNHTYEVITEKGPWKISAWPKDFPPELEKEVERSINREHQWGCCGRCADE